MRDKGRVVWGERGEVKEGGMWEERCGVRVKDEGVR